VPGDANVLNGAVGILGDVRQQLLPFLNPRVVLELDAAKQHIAELIERPQASPLDDTVRRGAHRCAAHMHANGVAQATRDERRALLRRITALETSLRLANAQLIEVRLRARPLVCACLTCCLRGVARRVQPPPYTPGQGAARAHV
jgi:hypothetical protein